MRVYPSRNVLVAKQFIHEVLNYCEGKPVLIIDNAPWLKKAIEELGLKHIQNPSDRSLIESVYSSFSREQRYSSTTQHQIHSTKAKDSENQYYAGNHP